MRIAVLGAGYAGVTLARRLERSLPSDVDLVVVNDNPSHLVQHEVHRVIRRPGVAEAIQVPLAEVFDRAEVVVDRVESVDADAGHVTLAGGDLEYDYGAVCLGAETAYYDLPGVRDHAIPCKRVDHARRIRERALSLGDGARVVVGGAGLSGVQVAGELAALRREEAVDVEVVLLEMRDEVAPTFPPNFRTAVREALEARDVVVRTGTAVERATEAELEVGDRSLAYDAFVWTGGITGRQAMDGERPQIRSDLRLSRTTFVVGDAARAVDADGEPVPASASAAIREARTVTTNLTRLVADGGEWEPRLDQYRFEVPGWIVSVGDGAVAQVGPTVVTGAAARALKATVGAGHLSSVGAVQRAVELVESELGA